VTCPRSEGRLLARSLGPLALLVAGVQGVQQLVSSVVQGMCLRMQLARPQRLLRRPRNLMHGRGGWRGGREEQKRTRFLLLPPVPTQGREQKRHRSMKMRVPRGRFNKVN